MLKPGGRVAVTVPRWFPERICWALSDEYHANEGGHIRIYTAPELCGPARRRRPGADGRHHAHALHARTGGSSARWARRHRRSSAPTTGCSSGTSRRGPWLTRTAERVLDPLFGKSLVRLRRQAREQPCTALTPDLPGDRPPRSGSTVDSIAAVQQPRRRASRGSPAAQLDPWDYVEAAMALDVGGEHAERAGRLPVAARPSSGRTARGRRSTATAPPAATSARAPRGLPRRRAAGTTSWPPATRRSWPSCGRRCAAGWTSWCGTSRPAGRSPGRCTRRPAPTVGPADRERQPLPGAAVRRRARRAARRAPSPTGNWPRPTCGRRCAPGRTRSPTRAATRWTGTTRCSAARSAARPPADGWPSAGTSSSSPGSACAAWPTGRGSPAPRRASWRSPCTPPATPDGGREQVGRHAAPARRRRLVLDRPGLRRRRALAGRAHHVDRRRRGARRRRAGRRPPARHDLHAAGSAGARRSRRSEPQPGSSAKSPESSGRR